MNGNLFHGVSYLFRGAKLITEPKLRRFVIAPIAVNLLLFVALISWVVSLFSAQMERLQAWLPGWLNWLEWFIWPLVIIALLLLVSYTFVTLANIIAAPFNGLLAERVEMLLGGEELPPTPWKQLLREFIPTMVNEVRKLGYFVRYAVPIGLLLLFPITSIIGTPLWLAFTSWMLALEYLDYPMANHKIMFKEVRVRAAGQRLTTAGFGIVVMVASTIPLLNLLVMPAAVAGATAAWVERYRQLPKP